MEKYKLGDMEQKFADIILANKPVSSHILTEICEKEFEWKRTTTYTMLKRLCDRNIFVNNNGTVTSLMSKEDFGVAQGEEFLDNAFNGSLPQFFAAFTRRKKLSANEIQKMFS